MTTKAELMQQLCQWVEDKATNGIRQHSPEWHEARKYTVGGSSLGYIQGLSRFKDAHTFVAEKIGLTKSVFGIAPKWGTLFEELIKQYVEADLQCEIVGEDLFVFGEEPGTTYSPDGLTVLNANVHSADAAASTDPVIMLIEFKCPYSRIPNGKVMESYETQVKMGLDLLKLPTVGLFIEGVFRRCSWEQLGNTADYDRTLIPRSSGKMPRAYGIIGFYCVDITAVGLAEFIAEYLAVYDLGDSANDYASTDLGTSSLALFTHLLNAFDVKLIQPWYGNVVCVTGGFADDTARADYQGSKQMDNELLAFEEFCRTSGYINLGILPWKLFRVDYHQIEKEDGYLAPWMPAIAEIIDVMRRCTNDPDARLQIFSEYTQKDISNGFV